MVTIHTIYRGELRCDATHGPSRSKLTTDAPVDNHGKGESFSPTDLLATALGTCMVTVMGIRARAGGWDIDGTTVEVRKHMVAQPTRRVGKLEVVLHVRGQHAPDARAALEAAGHGCPVLASLHPDVEVAVSFHWEGA